MTHAPAIHIDTRCISREPKEIYGPAEAPLILRIGNGGAGPTGLLRALAERFLNESGRAGRIAWYQDISVNTLAQLRAQIIDVALVYEREEALQAAHDGYAAFDALVFNDHFVIAGPAHNPAGISDRDDATVAFSKIAALHDERASRPLFLSRHDASGTNIREREIWRCCTLMPWDGAEWYVKRHHFPQVALCEADVHGVYTLSDHGTFMSTHAQLKNTILIMHGGDLLRNPCHALLQNRPSEIALAFHAFLISARGQACIESFGVEQYGRPLFTKASQLEF